MPGGAGWRTRTYLPWSRPRPMRVNLVWIWVGAALAVVVATGYGFVWSSDQAGNDALDRMTLRAEKAAASATESVDASRAAVETIIAQPGVEQVFADPEGCTLSVPPSLHLRLDIVGLDGSVACSSQASAVGAAGVHSDSAWLDGALGSSGTVITWDGVDPATGEPSVDIAARIDGTGTQPAGAAALFLHLPSAATELSADLPDDEHATVTILDARSGAAVSTSTQTTASAPAAASADFGAAQGQWLGLDGTERFFGSSDVAGSPWLIYVGAERSAVLADARGLLARQALIGLLALVLLAAAMIVLDRRVAAPLRTVTAAVAGAGRDLNSAHVEEVGTSELVALVRQFNAMLDLRAGHEAQLLHLATHDPVTGLPNALLLRDRLHHALRRDGRETDLAVLCLGLDRFKNVNDGLGYDVGDRVLRDVSERIAKELRPGDTLARFGGDEFVIVCEDTGADGAITMVERLQQSFRPGFDVSDTEIVLQASIGIAITERRPSDAEQMLREASTAMQQAKKAGGGWRLFTGESQERAARHLAVEQALRDALRRREFVVYYQPMVDVASGTIVGAEALVRWQHPTRGLLPPSDFIPVAEQTGRVGAIGAFVLTQACQQAAVWSDTGHPLRVSVNVAAAQLDDADFPDLVERTLTHSGLPAEQLCLEITESSLVRHDDHAVGNLMRLHAVGVHLSIDDFGTGYSSLAYLHRLPVDELKVDRSFIARLGDDTRDVHLVEAIIRMAHALGLVVVAEGVEAAEQLAALARLHCQRAQGHLFAAPQTAEHFADLVAAEARAASRSALAGAPPP